MRQDECDLYPDQYADMRRADLLPEECLLVSMLEQVFHSIVGKHAVREVEKQDDVDWLCRKNDTSVFSCSSICSHFDIDQDRLISTVLTWNAFHSVSELSTVKSVGRNAMAVGKLVPKKEQKPLWIRHKEKAARKKAEQANA